jgi:ribosome biogenesis SPOUT family RNA methylase Rps3
MKAIVETSMDEDTLEWRATLLEEYRKELREWSRARLSNNSNTETPEILESLKRIEKLERMLRNWASRRYRLQHQ